MDRLLFISSFFPNKSAPNIATYNRQQLLSLSEICEIDAVVPIPWTLIPRYKKYICEDVLGKIKLYHPVYYYLPAILRYCYGNTYYWSISSTIKKLSNAKKYDCVFSSWLYPDAWAASLVARKLNLPLVVSVLGSDVNRLKVGDGFIKRSLEVGRRAEKIICVSSALRDRLITLGFDSEKLIYLQNGVDKDIFHPVDKLKIRSEMNFKNDDKIILFVGNLKKEKGLLELVNAFSSLLEQLERNKTLLLIVGSGKFFQQLSKVVSDLGILSNVKFMGEKSPEEIAKLMNASDVLCLPSYSEGQPNVVIEALSCHTKVVSTNVGGIPELDTGKNNMELVEPRNIPELERALSLMLSRNDDIIQWQAFKSWHDNATSLCDVFSGCGSERASIK